MGGGGAYRHDPALDLSWDYAAAYLRVLSCRCSGIRSQLGRAGEFCAREAGRRPVLYLCFTQSLESHLLKRDNTYWWCLRARTARRAGCPACFFGIWRNRNSATASATRTRSNLKSRRRSDRRVLRRLHGAASRVACGADCRVRKCTSL